MRKRVCEIILVSHSAERLIPGHELSGACFEKHHSVCKGYCKSTLTIICQCACHISLLYALMILWRTLKYPLYNMDQQSISKIPEI